MRKNFYISMEDTEARYKEPQHTHPSQAPKLCHPTRQLFHRASVIWRPHALFLISRGPQDRGGKWLAGRTKHREKRREHRVIIVSPVLLLGDKMPGGTKTSVKDARLLPGPWLRLLRGKMKCGRVHTTPATQQTPSLNPFLHTLSFQLVMV